MGDVMVTVMRKKADLVIRRIPEATVAQLGPFRRRETLDGSRSGLVGADMKYNRHVRAASGEWCFW